MIKRFLFLCVLAACAVLLTACAGEKATKAEFFTYTVDLEDNAAVTGYTGNEANVIIPSRLGGHPVTAIADKAFDGNKLVGRVTLPKGVKSIGAHAFSKCTALQEIILPETLTTIGAYAFTDCTGLETVQLPKSLRLMGAGVFERSGLTAITLPAGVSHGSEPTWCSWFADCIALRTVVYEEGTTEIVLDDFHGTRIMEITSFTVPASVTTVKKPFRDYVRDYGRIRWLEFTADNPGHKEPGLLVNARIKNVHVKKDSFAHHFFEGKRDSERFIMMMQKDFRGKEETTFWPFQGDIVFD